MRQPDWRTWLLEPGPYESAQILFLLHPEWEEFASQTETGGLVLEIPCGNGAIRLECLESIVILSGIPMEPRQAMRVAESLLKDELESRMRG
jgi:hypothetical protein